MSVGIQPADVLHAQTSSLWLLWDRDCPSKHLSVGIIFIDDCKLHWILTPPHRTTGIVTVSED